MLLDEHLFTLLQQDLLGALVQVEPNALLLLLEPLLDLFHVLGDRVLAQELGTLAVVVVLGARDERRLEVLFVDLERRRLFHLFRLRLVEAQSHLKTQFYQLY